MQRIRFIYGPTGVGKTFLLKAIARKLAGDRQRRMVVYITAEELVSRLLQSIQGRRTKDFRRRYQSISTLLIDDIHFLEGRIATQEELGYMLDGLYKSGGRIIISADRPPDEIFETNNVFIDNLRQGAVIEIKPPGYKMRLQFLKEKACELGVDVSRGIFETLAHRISPDFRKLESALMRLKFKRYCRCCT